MIDASNVLLECRADRSLRDRLLAVEDELWGYIMMAEVEKKHD